MDGEFNIGLLNSTLFSKHYLRRFGFSVGFGLYDRSLSYIKTIDIKQSKLILLEIKIILLNLIIGKDLIFKIDNFRNKNIISKNSRIN